ncbi:MAG: hypothetical protein H0W76_10655 [Pyrinomonadaceae bacterium]|nr:hypothetical protein [Pyrinomonadaceae bacterium]
MTSYLLGELSEPEQTALEEKYFSDPRVFDQILKTENELVDNYARGRVSPRVRERFEQYYLLHPGRRERMKFAEALATRIDNIEPSGNVVERPASAMSWWRGLLATLRGQRLMLRFSIAFASLLLVLGGAWFFIDSRRARQELAQTQAVPTDEERRERELEQKVAEVRVPTEEPSTEPEPRRPAQQQSPQMTPTPLARAVPAYASLLLAVGGVRGGDAGKTPILVIPPGTVEARLQLNLKENEYARYRVSLQAVGGGEIFSRRNLKPGHTKAGASVTLVVPARKFTTGDYILTLRGVNRDGEIDDLSKSIFRVDKK